MIVRVDPKSSVPVFQQLMDEIKAVIARGACGPDAMIPSVRQMATQALVNPNTVAKAYRELERDGILYTRRGLGVFVSSAAPELSRNDRHTAVAEKLARAITAGRRAGLRAKELRRAFDLAMKDHRPSKEEEAQSK